MQQIRDVKSSQDQNSKLSLVEKLGKLAEDNRIAYKAELEDFRQKFEVRAFSYFSHED